MIISDSRKRMMDQGDVFAGLNKIKNKHQRVLIESQRHNKWMDMQGISKSCPVKWVKAFLIGRQPDYVEKILKEIIVSYKSVKHPHADAYYDSKTAKYNIGFYKNALGYLKNHY
ncbi:MAG: hypothetical protein COB41_00615 [Proteobacteria bacterium]|nr:MAG: hypothetical protein COB41_00615 [Pseudomonadota bacterium]